MLPIGGRPRKRKKRCEPNCTRLRRWKRSASFFALPNFEAHDLAGKAVASADLKGGPVLLSFLAVHCRHSMDSFPILKELQDTYGPQGLHVVAVLINSGSVEDVNGWVHEFEPNYDIWVKNDAALGDLIRSHLVPTYLFVDAQGQVTEKLVGFKARGLLVKRVASRFPQESSETTAAAGR